MDESAIIQSVRTWVEGFVVGENLCPFAQRELMKDRVRFTVSSACREQALLIALREELAILKDNPEIETTLLIHPNVLQDFADYNQFLDPAEELLERLDLTGIFQIASFHPDYQFANTRVEDAENYSNRSPYPLLHLLREDSIERAVAAYEGIDRVPERNIEHLKNLGSAELRRRWLISRQDQLDS